MNKSFNLKTFVKTAFYDDARGHMQGQTRCMQNCYKQKYDEKKTPQEAWQKCLDEYNTAKDKGKWILDYGADKDTGNKLRPDGKTPAASKSQLPSTKGRGLLSNWQRKS